jgi:hypothetical protein
MTRFLFRIAIPVISTAALSMELPPSTKISEAAHEAPQYSVSWLNKEEAKFEKYGLKDPQEKFLPLLRRELGQELGAQYYLNNLQWFASTLLIQHMVIQTLAKRNYSLEYKYKLNEEKQEYAKRLGLKEIEGEKLAWDISNTAIDDVEEALAHSKVISNTIIKPEHLEVIFSWIIDPSKSTVLHSLGQTLKNIREYELAIDLEKKLKQEFYTLFSQELVNQLVAASAVPLIKTNAEYLANILKIEAATTKRQEGILKRYKDASKDEQITMLIPTLRDYIKENSAIINLYEKTSDSYERMYALAREELSKMITSEKEKTKGDPQLIRKIVDYNFIVPLAARESGTFPKVLPIKLEPFKKASELITLPSLNKELEQARQAFEKQKEAEKKEKVNARKQAKTRISINNPINKTIEVLFKSDQPFQIRDALPPLRYTPWVNAWFEDPQKALAEQGYLDPSSKKFTAEHLRWKMIALHAFSKDVDKYIKEWGIKTEIPSRREKGKNDWLITIPGLMISPDGTQETGVYSYLINPRTGDWFHRMFTPLTGQKLILDLFEKGYFVPEMTGYYDVYFPPLPKKR